MLSETVKRYMLLKTVGFYKKKSHNLLKMMRIKIKKNKKLKKRQILLPKRANFNSYNLLKPYLVNKQLWYTQKKNIINYKNFIKPYMVDEIIQINCIKITSKINDFKKKYL